MIIATVIVFQIPSWVVVWPAYTDISSVSATWSPRDSIVERFNQLGYTIAEAIVSGIYIKSLSKLLKAKSSVRQRRVMLNLIYVNVLIVALGLIEMILFWLNVNGLSYPIQTFSHLLKFRLKFVVLNQIMAVAARGIYRESFAEKRTTIPLLMMTLCGVDQSNLWVLNLLSGLKTRREDMTMLRGRIREARFMFPFQRLPTKRVIRVHPFKFPFLSNTSS